MAASEGHSRAVELLLDNGADINEIDDGKGTALMIAASFNRIKAVEVLLKKNGARQPVAILDLNQHDQGKEALSIAESNKYHAIAGLLKAEMPKKSFWQFWP